MTKQQLLDAIAALEEQLEPLKAKLSEIFSAEAKSVEERIKEAYKHGNGGFTLNELRFSATTKCDCGLGVAYPSDIGMWGGWHCSGILLGTADRTAKHCGELPFSMYEIKSEDQPSAEGATTRPATQELINANR